MNKSNMLSTLNFMVDIETLGVNVEKAPIVEIAIVPFSSYKAPELSESLTKDLHIALNAGMQKNRIAEQKTLDFHKKLGHDVKTFFKKGLSPDEACKAIREYFKSFSEVLQPTTKIKFWCCGTDFDFPFLRSFMKQNLGSLDEKELSAFPFYMCNDVRTIYHMAEEYSDWKRAKPTDGTAHTAHADCISQIENLYEAQKRFCNRQKANESFAEVQAYWKKELQNRDRQITIYDTLLKLLKERGSDEAELVKVKGRIKDKENLMFLLRLFE